MSNEKYHISIDRCPQHRNFWAISIMDEHGGTRITPSKCCGRWKEVKQWPITEGMIKDIRDELNKVLGSIKRKRKSPGVSNN